MITILKLIYQNIKQYINSSLISWTESIEDKETKALAGVLASENCKATEINLRANKIGDKGAKALAQELASEHCKVTKIILKHNRIGDEGAEALAIALQSEYCKVTNISLEYNRIGDEGAAALEVALRSNRNKIDGVLKKLNETMVIQSEEKLLFKAPDKISQLDHYAYLQVMKQYTPYSLSRYIEKSEIIDTESLSYNQILDIIMQQQEQTKETILQGLANKRFADFPQDVVCNIYSILDIEDVMNIAQVTKLVGLGRTNVYLNQDGVLLNKVKSDIGEADNLLGEEQTYGIAGESLVHHSE